MRRRVAAAAAVGLGALGVAAVLVARSPAHPVLPPPERPYNVVLVVVDTLRADHLGAWGYPRDTSPHLDAFAARSRQYTRAVSQAAWTTPSVGSLMTSAYPMSLGLEEEHAVLQRSAWTLAEALQGAGLATAAVVSHWFCADEYGFGQGFDQFDDRHALGHTGVSSERVSDAALAFLDAREPGAAPFFLWLHYFDPHFAYTLHEDHDPTPAVAYDGPVRSDLRFSRLQELPLDDADLAQLNRLYDSEIAFTDRQIGRVLDGLEAAGILDETLVIVTADHGEEFRDHGQLGHGKTVYQELVHVPLIVRCPHWAPGVVDVPVANLDIFPTVLACLGLPAPPGLLLGRPLGPGPVDARTVFSQSGKRNRVLAAFSGDLKLIRRGAKLELYDLARDPGEEHDLAEGGHPELDRLAAELEAHRRALRRSADLPVKNDPGAEVRGQLEALGYTE